MQVAHAKHVLWNFKLFGPWSSAPKPLPQIRLVARHTGACGLLLQRRVRASRLACFAPLAHRKTKQTGPETIWKRTAPVLTRSAQTTNPDADCFVSLDSEFGVRYEQGHRVHPVIWSIATFRRCGELRSI